MQTYAPNDAPRAAPVLAAHCGRSAPGSALARPTCRRPPSPPSRTAPGMHHAPTDAGRIAARRAPGRSMPTRAGLPIRTNAALALRPLTAGHTACAPGFLSPATACPPAPPALHQCAPHGTPRHQGLAARRWLPCARLRRPRPCERPEQSQSGGGSKLHNEELSAACRLSGYAGSHCVACFRLARLPPAHPRRWLPKSRRWRDGDLWISRLFSPSLHHECRSPGVRYHKTTKNQGMALVRCRICYLLLTFSQGIASLLPFSKRGRQWHTFKSASMAMALPRTGY